MPEKKVIFNKKKRTCLEIELLTVQSRGSGDRQAKGVLPSSTAHIRTGTKEMTCLQLLLSVCLAIERTELGAAFLCRFLHHECLGRWFHQKKTSLRAMHLIRKSGWERTSIWCWWDLIMQLPAAGSSKKAGRLCHRNIWVFKQMLSDSIQSQLNYIFQHWNYFYTANYLRKCMPIKTQLRLVQIK